MAAASQPILPLVLLPLFPFLLLSISSYCNRKRVCVIPLSVARYTTGLHASDASGCSVLVGKFLPEALCF